MAIALTTGWAHPPAAVMAQDPPSVTAILEEFERISGTDLWPDFHPSSIPLLIYDGRQTWLYGHPQPPPEFAPSDRTSRLWVASGQHEAARANTGIDIAGVPTATLLAERSSVSPAQYARTLVHETFHVFQRARHATWGANEVELFTYPFTDTTVLTLRKLETEALGRALRTDRATTACWVRVALDIRQRRFDAMPQGSAAYERGTELAEGIATYVELRAANELASFGLPEEGFAADEIRLRGYAVGTALAVLLDRLTASWREDLEHRDSSTLDQAVQQALGEDPESVCEFAPNEVLEAATWARNAAARLAQRRTEARDRVRNSPGWIVTIIAAPAEPLFPQRFDPLNVQILSAEEVLHTRWIQLTNRAASIDVQNLEALTESAGTHPLFNGLRRITVVGLGARRPDVTAVGDSTTVRALGLHGRFHGAQVAWSGTTLTVTLPAGSSP